MKFEIKSVEVSVRYGREKGHSPYPYASKMYIYPENETVIENLISRRQRPVLTYKKEVIPAVLEKIKAEFPDYSISADPKKWGWRQKCGCSCPCSPGFINVDTYPPYDIHVQISILK